MNAPEPAPAPGFSSPADQIHPGVQPRFIDPRLLLRYLCRVPAPRTPSLTTDAVIVLPGDRVVLVRRKHPPPGWAIPGGFVDVGETVEAAAIREAREETGLDVTLTDLLGVYSDPRRDARGHTASAVFLCRASGEPAGADDAAEAGAFRWDELPAPIAFDHGRILADARRFLLTGVRPRP